jgi:hypothetical protein
MEAPSNSEVIAAMDILLNRLEVINKGLQGALLVLLRTRFRAIPPDVEAKILATTDREKLRIACYSVIIISEPHQLLLD